MRIPSPRQRLNFARAGLAVALAVIAGCADLRRSARLEPEGVNVESPAAGAVQAAQARATPFPSFRDVPPRPSDVRPATGYARAVSGLTGERAGFRAWEAENPAILSDMQGYATATRGAVQTTASDIPPADQTQRSTDWARRAREAAKAPPAPAPKPGPQP